jgi:hypothetical protein
MADEPELRLETPQECIETVKRIIEWAGADNRKTRVGQRMVKLVKEAYTMLQDQTMVKRIDKLEQLLAAAGISKSKRSA